MQLYPDDYLIRYFFKSNFNSRTPGHVLELGCGDGNNLELFNKFGWSVTGLDFSFESISHARTRIPEGTFYCEDLNQAARVGWLASILEKEEYDVVILANSTYYLTREARLNILSETSNLIRGGGSFFLRERLITDGRREISEYTPDDYFLISSDQTGEIGLQIILSSREQVMADLANLGFEQNSLTVLECKYDNIQNSKLISNHDLVVWN